MTGKHEGIFRLKALTAQNIILIAARHNRRESLSGEWPDNIDVSKSHLNRTICGPDGAKRVDDLAKKLVSESKTPTPRVNAVKAIEFVFSLPQGSSVNADAFFEDCTTWVGSRFGGAANILSSDIHRDESNPHCHVLLLPLLDGRMRGSAMIGGKKELAAHHESFHAEVAAMYGLARRPPLLKGQQKEAAVWEVLRRLQADAAGTLAQCSRAIHAAIALRPDEWAEDLGIAVSAGALEQLALNPGSGPKTRAGAGSSDRRLMERAVKMAGLAVERLASRAGEGDPALSKAIPYALRERLSKLQEGGGLECRQTDGESAVTRVREDSIPAAYYDHERGEFRQSRAMCGELVSHGLGGEAA